MRRWLRRRLQFAAVAVSSGERNVCQRDLLICAEERGGALQRRQQLHDRRDLQRVRRLRRRKRDELQLAADAVPSSDRHVQQRFVFVSAEKRRRGLQRRQSLHDRRDVRRGRRLYRWLAGDLQLAAVCVS